MHTDVQQALSLLNGFVYAASVTGLLQSFVYDPEAQEMIHLPSNTVLTRTNDFEWSIKHA